MKTPEEWGKTFERLDRPEWSAESRGMMCAEIVTQALKDMRQECATDAAKAHEALRARILARILEILRQREKTYFEAYRDSLDGPTETEDSQTFRAMEMVCVELSRQIEALLKEGS